jgi:hypothetical protein
MKFSEQKSQVEGQSQSGALPDFKSEFLIAQTQPQIEPIRKKCVYHLTDDITKTKNDLDINKFLGDQFYSSSNDFAYDCLGISFYVQNIYGSRIKLWTESALKCFDNFLIRYINHVKQEKIKKMKDKPYETDVYEHLIGKGGKEYEIGIAFQSIYQSRNTFTHVQEEEIEGIRRPVKWSGKRYNREKELILMQFEKGLKQFLCLVQDR